MHLISPFISGVRNAENGSAKIVKRGTVTRATLYSSFEGDSFPTGSLNTDHNVILDSYGRTEVYVDEICDVYVFDADGTQQIVFTAGSAASVIELRSQAFTGTDYDTAVSGPGQPTTLQAVLDQWFTAHAARDWSLTAQLPIFDVTDPLYGALGDGTTDDTTAIQAALTAAQSVGGIVYLPPGEYRVTSQLVASAVFIYGPSNATLVIDHPTAGLIQTQGTRIYGITLQSYGTGVVVDASILTTISHCTITGRGVLLQAGDTAVVLEDTILTAEGWDVSDTLLQVVGTVGTLRATRCSFKAATEYTPSDDAMIYGNNMHFDECVFSAATTTVGVFSYVKFNASAVVGSVRASTFVEPNAATVTAITLGAYIGGSRFFESDNSFQSGVILYSYTASVGTSGVHLRSRENLVKNLTDNDPTVALPTDQYGLVILTSTHAAPVMTGTLPPYGAKGTVIFYHPSGGAGTAQPTTNFFGATAAITADLSSHAWQYVSAAPNAALRMVCVVDAKALGTGAP